MYIHEIQEAMRPLCQRVLQEEISVGILDAIENATEGGMVPLQPYFFAGYAGLGKTHATREMAEILAKKAGYSLLEIPAGCSTAVLSKILIDNLDATTPYIIFLDELHGFNGSAHQRTRNLLKVLTETGGKIKEITVPLGKEEFKVTVNPFLHWFIAASNESVKDTALVGSSGRFKTINFMPYNEESKRYLFRVMSPHYAQGIDFTQEMEDTAIRNVRPFARSIKNLLMAIRTRARLGDDITTKAGMVESLIKSGYVRGGWTTQHLKALVFIDKCPRQVQEISGCLQTNDQALTQAILAELMQDSLIRTENGKKIITVEGQAFLKSLKKK